MINDLTWWSSCGRTTTSGDRETLTLPFRLQKQRIVVDAAGTLTITGTGDETGTEMKGMTMAGPVIVVDAHEKMNGIQVTVKMSGTDATKMIAIQDVMMTAARKILSVEADRHRKENQSPLQKEEVNPPVLAA